ncbi:hypothetical protein Mmc1_0005 [Magnetococcus marinus MC-1]|uniref:TIGR02646 family protein n=1 Tax=Magnetococcus marinus (strain ATCC BAA-1437 / JCM 17883 / MC-1) TaxID=156889 RepID=A0L3J1_MAGMM|nr:HNH endonuclease [Magnetococcus marinus]ABK42534.1 hypothetical protein Mmc1_0005 [Magnetococcus marinus MC-1]
MRHVKHTASLTKLDRAKTKDPCPTDPAKAWRGFKHKDDVAKQLKLLQDGLCAYCQVSLDTELGYHIDHIQPKGPNPKQTFVWHNLVLSCIASGSQGAVSGKLSCGHAKGNQALPKDMDPTHPDCESLFTYTLSGKVEPNPDRPPEQVEDIKKAIELLNLNNKRLVRERAEMLHEGYLCLKDLNGSAVAHFLDLELGKTNGKHRAFITARKLHFQDWPHVEPIDNTLEER